MKRITGKCTAAKHGPKRDKNSNCKMSCSWKNCRSGRDVKNVGEQLTATIREVDKTRCRSLRSSCQTVRFCCVEHKNHCIKKASANPRGKRECMDEAQCRSLWTCLLEKVQCPWAAILFLTQLCLGERAEAATSVRVSWVHNLQQEHGNPCYIEIPDGVNEKTKARTVPMLQCFANLLRGWMYASPLVTPDGGQWPFPEQPLQDPQCCLFPGLQVNGNKLTRTWTRPISTRAYLKKIREAADILHRERADMQSRGLPSVWDETDLAKLGTHSMKRTCVSLLKDKCRSSAVVGAICGTTPATLDREYDAPTQRRQRMALQDALGPVLDVSAASVFCTGCRTERQSPKWIYCPACGTKFA